MPRKRAKPESFVVLDVRASVIEARGQDDDGRWYWRALRRRRGMPRIDKALGWHTPESAKRALMTYMLGLDAEPEPEPTDSRVETIRDMIEFFVGHSQERADRGEIALSSYKSYAAWASGIVASMGDIRLDRFDSTSLARWRDKWLAAGASSNSVSNRVTLVRMAWQWGVEIGVCPQRVLGHVRVRIKTVRAKVTPTPDQFWAVVNDLEARGLGTPRYAMLGLIILGTTGMRPSDIGRLRWQDVDIDGQPPRITIARGKTTGTVVISARAAEAFREQPRTSEGVWGVTHNSFRFAVSRMLNRADWEALGQERWTLYGLRRMVGEAYMRNGVDIGTYAAQMLHSPKIALQHYSVVRDEARVAAVAAAEPSLAKPSLSVVKGGCDQL